MANPVELLADDDEAVVLEPAEHITSERIDHIVEQVVELAFLPPPTKPTFLQWVFGS